MEVALRAVNLICVDGLLAARPGRADPTPRLLALALPARLVPGAQPRDRRRSTATTTWPMPSGCVWLGRVFAGVGEAARGRATGVAMVRRAADEQVLADGLDHEGSLPYHLLVLELFLLRARGRPDARRSGTRVERLVDARRALRRPGRARPGPRRRRRRPRARALRRAVARRAPGARARRAVRGHGARRPAGDDDAVGGRAVAARAARAARPRRRAPPHLASAGSSCSAAAATRGRDRRRPGRVPRARRARTPRRDVLRGDAGRAAGRARLRDGLVHRRRGAAQRVPQRAAHSGRPRRDPLRTIGGPEACGPWPARPASCCTADGTRPARRSAYADPPGPGPGRVARTVRWSPGTLRRGHRRRPAGHGVRRSAAAPRNRGTGAATLTGPAATTRQTSARARSLPSPCAARSPRVHDARPRAT